MKLLPVWYWLAEAATVFLNGAISSCVVGGAVGGVASFDGSEPVKTAHYVLTAAVAYGIKRVVVWHDSNEFPNPFPKPSSEKPTETK